jgi:aryl-alcohol dehydrogenase-like predicted oxidoreductase
MLHTPPTFYDIICCTTLAHCPQPAEEVIGRYNEVQSTHRANDPASTPSKPPIQAFTKWCPTDPDTALEAVEAAVDLALKRMGQSRLDLLQYHIWNYTNPAYLCVPYSCGVETASY